jgi:putative mycofactocin binding protein MftB
MATELLARDPLAVPWEIAPLVALRPEPFGALAYHFGTRRLTFLKTPELAAVVRSLGDHADLRAALVSAGVAPGAWDTYAKALVVLADADMIRPRETSGA